MDSQLPGRARPPPDRANPGAALLDAHRGVEADSRVGLLEPRSLLPLAHVRQERHSRGAEGVCVNEGFEAIVEALRVPENRRALARPLIRAALALRRGYPTEDARG